MNLFESLLKENKKISKKLKESFSDENVGEVVEFLEKAVEGLKVDQEGCWTYKFPHNGLGVCVGWSSGYDPNDKSVIHAQDDPTWAIVAGVKVWTSDAMRTDFDWINSPYYESGDVWDTDVSINPNENYKDLAEYFVKEYHKMEDLDMTEDGKILNYEDDFDEDEEELDESKKVVKEFVETDAPFYAYRSRGFRVPEDVKENITHIIIEDGVESIQRSAFANCSSLEEIQIPESVVSIGPGAFEGCSSLKFIQLPSGLEEIRAYTFAGCTSLKEITIPENTTWIAYGAFAHSGLTYVKILSKGLDYIADDAFDGCDPLLDATQATINFAFGAFCEKNDLACEVEFEESKKVVKENTNKDFIWDYWGNGRYRVEYKNQECDVYSDWKHKGRYVIDRIDGKTIPNAQNLTKSEAKKLIKDYIDNGSINESKKVVKESYSEITLDEIANAIQNDYTYGLTGDGTSWRLDIGDGQPDEVDILEIVHAIKEDYTYGITGNGVTWDLDIVSDDFYDNESYFNSRFTEGKKVVKEDNEHRNINKSCTLKDGKRGKIIDVVVTEYPNGDSVTQYKVQLDNGKIKKVFSDELNII